MEQEKKVLAKALVAIEKPYSKHYTIKEIINKEEIIKKLINFIDNDDAIEESSEVIMKMLKILG